LSDSQRGLTEEIPRLITKAMELALLDRSARA
jgi:hypothetical protein